MANTALRNQAIKLRKQGLTYSEIKLSLNIPKSTLSEWLHGLPLSKSQLVKLDRKIELNKYLAIEKIRATKLKKRELRLSKVLAEEKKRLTPLTEKDLELAGLFLYWGEGNKNLKGPVSICNTDPQIVKFAVKWIILSLRIPREKIKVFLHLYREMNIKTAKNFWSKELGIPISQFSKPYIKQSTRKDLNHKGFGYGTCTVSVNDVRLKERIIMGIKALASHYDKVIPVI